MVQRLIFPNATTFHLAQLRSVALSGLCLLTFFANTASTQEVTTAAQPLPEATAASLDQLVAAIAAEEEDIQRSIERRDESEGVAAAIFSARIDRSGTSMFRNVIALAGQVVAARDKGMDVSAYEAAVVEDLGALPGAIDGALARYKERVEFPSPDMPPQQFVYKDQVLFRLLGEVDDVHQIVIDYIAIAEDFGLDASQEQAFIVEALTEGAANRSVFLEIALNEVAALRSSITTLPENTELAEWHSAAQTRVTSTGVAMQRIIGLMNTAGIETRQYRRQLLSVTGGITTDVLDVGIITNIVKEWGAALLGVIATEGPKWVLRFLLVVVIMFVFFQISKLVQKGVNRALNSARVRVSHLLKEMISSSARNLVILFGILIALSQLGISLGPLLAGLGIAGFIIGFALQDSLSNFASGMLILLYRPFDVGDIVDSGGVRGRVSAMSLVNTTFLTLDNQKLVVPNNLIWQSVITNVTAQRRRRIDMTFGIAYSDDVEKAQKVLEDLLHEHEDVLDDPEPTVRVHELGESSVNFNVRPWVKTNDYWETYWAITKEVKLRFDREGISIPFPQRDVHLFEQKPE
jgi:small conductance mechanosensitive channel